MPVGSVAYQCYGGLLGARLDGAHHRTQDINLAQDRQVALAVAWGGQPPIDFEAILRQVDPSFRPDFNPMRPNAGPTRYRNDSQYRVDLLTTHAGSERDCAAPIKTPHLEGAALQPFEGISFLIKQPVRSVLLNDAGAAIVAPQPARYAIHNILVSQIRALSSEATKWRRIWRRHQNSCALSPMPESSPTLPMSGKGLGETWYTVAVSPSGHWLLMKTRLAFSPTPVRRHGGEDFGP